MEKLFKKYINSVISPEEFDQLADYMGKRENLPAVSEMMEPEWNRFLHDPDTSKANPVLLHKIKQIILLEERNLVRKKLKIYSFALRIAAVLLVGLIFAGILFYRQSGPVSEKRQTQTVSVPYGARTQFSLPDGSTVWLNSASTLTYSGNFSKQRKVELTGEGFFEVVKSEIPFMVNTIYGQINVLGTAFNVEAYPDNNYAVTLERGSVRLEDPEKIQEHTLFPGEQVRLEHGKFLKSKVRTELFTSWKDGKLIFQREPFPNMMERLERWYNVNIVYSASDFNDLWFTGTICDETLTEVMQMVCKAAPVGYHYNSQTRTIKITATN